MNKGMNEWKFLAKPLVNLTSNFTFLLAMKMKDDLSFFVAVYIQTQPINQSNERNESINKKYSKME